MCAVCATGVQQGPIALLRAQPLDWVQLGEPTTPAHPLGPPDGLPAWICPEGRLNLGWSQLTGFVQFSSSSRCFPCASSYFFSGLWLLCFFQPMRQQRPFSPLPLALVFLGGCNQTGGICLPRSVAATIPTVISDLYIQIIMVCTVAFVPLLLYIVTCMHLCIIHTLVS